MTNTHESRQSPSVGEMQLDDRSALRRVAGLSTELTVVTEVDWHADSVADHSGATAATLVFNKVFFAEGTSEASGLIAALLTYAVGFVARPLGGDLAEGQGREPAALLQRHRSQHLGHVPERAGRHRP